jgi:hypothetical protein
MTISGLTGRIGEDTVPALEAAAAKRFAEALELRAAGHLTGTVYLCGYVAEIRIGAAYFKANYGDAIIITDEVRKRVMAKARQDGFMKVTAHDIMGWANLLLGGGGRGPGDRYPKEFADSIREMASAISTRWKPKLRYRDLRFEEYEAEEVLAAARWFEEHYAGM